MLAECCCVRFPLASIDAHKRLKPIAKNASKHELNFHTRNYELKVSFSHIPWTMYSLPFFATKYRSQWITIRKKETKKQKVRITFLALFSSSWTKEKEERAESHSRWRRWPIVDRKTRWKESTNRRYRRIEECAFVRRVNQRSARLLSLRNYESARWSLNGPPSLPPFSPVAASKRWLRQVQFLLSFHLHMAALCPANSRREMNKNELCESFASRMRHWKRIEFTDLSLLVLPWTGAQNARNIPCQPMLKRKSHTISMFYVCLSAHGRLNIWMLMIIDVACEWRSGMPILFSALIFRFCWSGDRSAENVKWVTFRRRR